MEATQILIGVDGVALAGLLFMAGQNYKTMKDLVKRHDTCPVTLIDTDLKLLKLRVEMTDRFNNALGVHMSNVVRQNTEIERDVLIDKLVHDTIDLEESHKLATLLRNCVIEEEFDPTSMNNFAFQMLLEMVQIKIKLLRAPEELRAGSR